MEFLTFLGDIFMDKKAICLCSSALPESMATKLAENFRVFPLPPDDVLAEPVRSHPDMICTVMDDTIFFPAAYARKNRALIDEIEKLSGYSVVLCDIERGAEYPADVGLNAAVGDSFLICRVDSTAPELIKAAKASGRRIVDVNQGYAGCSCIVLGDAVLTTDRGIYRAAAQLSDEPDVSFMGNDGILLPGYDAGLIGGCGGCFGGRLYLFGDIMPLVESCAIYDFALRHSLEIVMLGENRLTDYGGVKFLG